MAFPGIGLSGGSSFAPSLGLGQGASLPISGAGGPINTNDDNVFNFNSGVRKIKQPDTISNAVILIVLIIIGGLWLLKS